MKEPTNIPWRKQSKRFPYGENVLEDKKYLKDRRTVSQTWKWMVVVSKR